MNFNNKTISELFQDQVEKTPKNIALVCDGEEITYRDLNNLSNQLAYCIREKYEEITGGKLESDTFIALHLDRSLEMIIGILAVLKAGGAYVPIDPYYPQERIKYIIEDSESLIVLTKNSLFNENLINVPINSIINIDLTEDLYKKTKKVNLNKINAENDLAYLIYTSGTTGKPKGVMIEHKSGLNTINSLSVVYNNSKIKKTSVFTSYSFDVSVSEIFNSLLFGLELHIFTDTIRYNIDSLCKYITSNKINLVYLPPLLLRKLPKKTYSDLVTLLYAGEPCDKKTVKYWSNKVNLFNYYGPTEASIYATGRQMLGDESEQIGLPIDNTNVYVLDESKNNIPIGVVGELYIAGAGLSRGYLNRPDLTSKYFIDNPFASQNDLENGYTRLYKTGDLVKWLPDGNLEFIGRNDDQVKINGFRIELGEIENTISNLEGIEQSCVLAKERKTDSGSYKYLVAYYVTDKSVKKQSKNSILDALSLILPEYMIPSSMVEIDFFPLTINGKLDKQALPSPDFNSPMDEFVAPTTDNEKELSEIWCHCLGLDRVGITDNFFRIGGNSILAIQLSHQMSKALERDVKVSDVFKYKTISEILTHSLGKDRLTIPKTESEKAHLSFAQERLWFIEQFEEGTNAYHIPEILRLAKDIDLQGVKYALQEIISRHDILRSTIEQGDDLYGGIQVVHQAPLTIDEITVAISDDYLSLIKAEIDRPFDLAKEYPIRIQLYTIHSNELTYIGPKVILLINTHHIASDGWSIGLLHKEFTAHYEAFVNKKTPSQLPVLSIQYKDYAVWQKTYLSEALLKDQLNYWKEKLNGFQTLEFPTDFTRPKTINYSGAYLDFNIPKNISQKLRALAQEHSISLHSLMLSSISILLNKYTGQEDIIIGSPIANRQQWQTENLIGFFVNTQVNRTLLYQNQRFDELIQQVHNEQIEAQLHQDLPFEKIVDELKVERDSSRHPIFQIMFELQNIEKKDRKLEQKYFQIESTDDVYQVEKFDLTITIENKENELTGRFSYATSLFHQDSIQQLANHYLYLLDQLIANPSINYSDVCLLTPNEYEQIIHQWNATDKEYPKEKTIVELFETQVELSPDNIAVVFENQQLTYSELNEKSNQLARHLREQYQTRTAKPLSSDTLIALFLDRSLEMVVGILAVLKAGGAYVPIDPTYPQERIDYILEDTQVELVLSQKSVNSHLLRTEKLVFIDLDEAFFNSLEKSNLPIFTKPDDLAYVIYTSGTTGKPKGVMIENVSAVNTLIALQEVYTFPGIQKTSAFTSYVFDVSVSEILNPLLTGMELHILSDTIRTNMEDLSNYLIKFKINLVYLPPVLLSQFPEKDYNDLKCLIYAGEPCDKQTVGFWSNKTKLFNYYGPTETSIYATGKQMSQNESEQIGQPIQNVTAYVLDQNNIPVPIGVIGELYIGGAGVARGYFNNPLITKERFIQNHFTKEKENKNSSNRLYKTGDLVKWLPDGNIEYIGRNDNQVKIRGYRIELGEIENVLLTIDEIQQSCVLVKEINTVHGVSKSLVAYYVTSLGHENFKENTISTYLKLVLPTFMVPEILIEIDAFPITTNGKIDKSALLKIDVQRIEEGYVKPTLDIEIEICSIWENILGVERIGITDDFFKKGGNSILAIQASHQMSKVMGCDVKVADIFTYPTCSLLVSYKNEINSILYVEGEL